MPVHHTQRKRDDVAWDVAEGWSLRDIARRNNVAISAIRDWLLEPEFAAGVQLCRMEIAKSMGDTLLARVSAANELVLKAIHGELDLDDSKIAQRVAIADRTLARSIDRLFDDPSVAVGFLRGQGRNAPALGAPTTGPAGDAPRT